MKAHNKIVHGIEKKIQAILSPTDCVVIHIYKAAAYNLLLCAQWRKLLKLLHRNSNYPQPPARPIWLAPRPHRPYG